MSNNLSADDFKPVQASDFQSVKAPPSGGLSSADFEPVQASNFQPVQLKDVKPIPSFHELDNVILKASRANGIDPKLLKAVGIQETGLGQSGVYDSSTGLSKTKGNAGHGIWQLDPASGADQATLRRAASDPSFAADYAAKMLKRLMNQYHGNMDQALAAYNAGTANSRAGQQYAQQVLNHYKSLDPLTEDPVFVQRVKHVVNTAVEAQRKGKDPLQAIGRTPEFRPIANVEKSALKDWEWAKAHKLEAVFDVLNSPQRLVGQIADEFNNHPNNFIDPKSKNLDIPELKKAATDIWDAVMHPTEAVNERTTASIGTALNRASFAALHGHVVPTHKEIDDYVRAHVWAPLQGPVATVGKTAEDIILQTISNPIGLERLAVSGAVGGARGLLNAFDRILSMHGTNGAFGLKTMANYAKDMGNKVFRVRNDLHEAGFTPEGVKIRTALENSHLNQEVGRAKDIETAYTNPQEAARLVGSWMGSPALSHIPANRLNRIIGIVGSPGLPADMRKEILTDLSKSMFKNGLARETNQIFSSNRSLFTGNLRNLDRIGIEDVNKATEWAKNSPLSGLRELGKKAIMWNPAPHGLKNVGTLAYQAGGIPAIARGLSAMVKPTNAAAVARLKNMGALPDYLDHGATGLFKHSNEALSKIEEGWRVGLMETLDRELGVPGTREEELLRGYLINHKVGDYRNQSAFVNFFKALGGPFVAFRLGIVPQQFAETLAKNPERIVGQLRLSQDLQRNRPKESQRKNELGGLGPTEDMAKLIVDPQEFLARSTGLQPFFETPQPGAQEGLVHRFVPVAQELLKAFIPGAGAVMDFSSVLTGSERPGETPTMVQQLEDAIGTALGLYYMKQKTGKQMNAKYKRIQKS